MTDSNQTYAYGEFITNIMKVLDDNGFPEKRVSLPLERMYETAHEKGINFNKVLAFLKEKGVDHEKTPEKIICISNRLLKN